MTVKAKYLAGALILLSGCITQFVPDIPENKSMLVVEGLITDQPGLNYVRLSMSMPVGKDYSYDPVGSATVKITDDLGNQYQMNEVSPGYYSTNPLDFMGIVGRKYRLNIQTNTEKTNFYSYESTQMELKPVPEIDSIFYEKVTESGTPGVPWSAKESARIFVATHDENNLTDHYRWEYEETWQFNLPYEVANKTCWVTEESKTINVKSTAVLSENRISKYPLLYINNTTDRLSARYSILVNQYSITDDEFSYWEKLKALTQNIGGLYDIIPASLNGNVYCLDEPTEKVLGYFSVSAKKSKRKFIKDKFFGQRNFYIGCANDTIYQPNTVPGLGVSAWIIEDWSWPRAVPGYWIISYYQRCADCIIRGSNIKPWFWED